MSLVSVVIPFHNEEYALPRCLDSVLSQTYGDIEVILVDDGSTDDSAAVCAGYAARDARVRLFRQDGAGVSVARNRGIELAAGEFALFADADDRLSPTLIARLTSVMGAEVDLAGCGFAFDYVDDPGRPPRNEDYGAEGRLSGTDYLALTRAVGNWNAFAPVWNKLYRLQRIRGNGLSFKPGMTHSEDLLFNIQYGSACRSVYLIRDPLYHYTIETRSGRVPMKERFEPDSIGTMLRLCRLLASALEKGCSESVLSQLKGTFASQMLVAVVRTCRRDSPLGRGQTLARLADLAGQPDVLEWLRHYRPGPGNSRIMPFLLRRGWLRPLFLLARSKADRRYRPARVTSGGNT